MTNEISQLAFQGFLEKCGLPINEAEKLKNITSGLPDINNFLQRKHFIAIQAEYRQQGYGKASKMRAANDMLSLSYDEEKLSADENFLFLKGFIACCAYHDGKNTPFESLLNEIEDVLIKQLKNEIVSKLLADPKRLQALKEQFIKSSALGSKKGIWSKIFG